MEIVPTADQFQELRESEAAQRVDQRVDRRAERLREQRERLETRHARALTSLLDTRRDLRGVHALADLVDDAVRWTA